MIYAIKPNIARFELETYSFLKSLVEENSIPCDWETVGGVHTIDTKEVVDLVARHIERLKRDFPDLAEQLVLTTDENELEKLRVPGAAGAVLQKCAAKLWPYKLVCWVLERLIDEGKKKFNLQTTTPVEHLQQVDDKKWVVHTPRGQIVSQNVVLATNAYTTYLLPKLTDIILPVRGQVCALLPSKGAKPLEHSHVWVSQGDDYLIQRPTGELILGGERLGTPEGEVGVSNDDTVDPDVGKLLREAMHSAVKLKPPGSEEDDVLQATHEWTGIMAYSRDNHPWVGQVPAVLGGGDGGLWLSGGYTGHGMPVAARCAIAVAEEILGKQSIKIPDEYRIETGREERAKTAVLPLTMEEEIRLMMKDLM